MKNYIITKNDGPEIEDSTYWESPMAAAGYYYISPNAGAFRLLAPSNRDLADMQAAKEIIISRGPWPAQNRDDALEILFDDHTQSPFCLWLTPESFERLPLAEDAEREWLLSVWIAGPLKLIQRPCHYRIVQKIPCMEPLKNE